MRKKYILPIIVGLWLTYAQVAFAGDPPWSTSSGFSTSSPLIDMAEVAKAAKWLADIIGITPLITFMAGAVVVLLLIGVAVYGIKSLMHG